MASGANHRPATSPANIYKINKTNDSYEQRPLQQILFDIFGQKEIGLTEISDGRKFGRE